MYGIFDDTAGWIVSIGEAVVERGVNSGNLSLLQKSLSEQQIIFVPWICADFPALHYTFEKKK